jgi:hypothetical protein
VDDLAAGSLDDTPHDVDGRIVPIKKGGRSDDADVVFGLVLFSN